MGETVSVERVVAAPPGVLWAMVADVTRMCEFSPENTRCKWIGRTKAPVVGAKFRGTNENGKKKWKTVATIVDAQPGHSFAFQVKAGPFGVARWEYRFDPTNDGGCLVTETWIDQRGLVGRTLAGPVSGVTERTEHNRAGMVTTLERLAASAENAAV
ncbi:MAG TPA: SRPBCC family protein [Acidimicrobiia bacterium]|nr:SRPBCC family protein [Acidimicrobiia bacterium]